jgi:Protein of unknown function (DUF3800)
MTRRYVFADESGNFDFRDHVRYPGASRYFAVGTVMIEGDAAVQALDETLLQLKRDLAWNNVVHDDAFHASVDAQAVRDAVFSAIAPHKFTVDVTLLEKSKSQPKLRVDEPTFYKYAWWFHFKHLAANFRPGDELLVVAASIGTKRRRNAFKDAVESVVRQCTDVRVPRQVAFWPVEAEPCLQVADYCVWAVGRAWEKGDDRAKSQIAGKVRTEWDYFQWGSIFYYGPRASTGRTA